MRVFPQSMSPLTSYPIIRGMYDPSRSSQRQISMPQGFQVVYRSLHHTTPRCLMKTYKGPVTHQAPARVAIRLHHLLNPRRERSIQSQFANHTLETVVVP